jgi:DUF438 domain-containing protein
MMTLGLVWFVKTAEEKLLVSFVRHAGYHCVQCVMNVVLDFATDALQMAGLLTMEKTKLNYIVMVDSCKP